MDLSAKPYGTVYVPFRIRKDGTVTDKTENVPHYVIPTAAQAEWRNPLKLQK